MAQQVALHLAATVNSGYYYGVCYAYVSRHVVHSAELTVHNAVLLYMFAYQGT